jgi:hypothetical protein
MKYFYFVITYLAFFACTSIKQDNVSSHIDSQANFMVYKTFAWLPKDSSDIQNILFDNQIVEKTIRSYVNEELKNRGYVENKGVPDIFLKYTFMIEKKQESINYPIYTNVPFPNQINYTPYNPSLYNYGTYPNYNAYYNNQYSPYNVNMYANNYPFNNGYGYPVGSQIGYPNGNGIPVPSATYVVGTGFQQIEIKEGTLVIDIIDKKANQLIWRGWSSEPLTDPKTFENRLPMEIKSIFTQYPGRADSLQTENK